MKKFPALFRRLVAIAAMLPLFTSPPARSGGEPPAAAATPSGNGATTGRLPVPYTARYSVTKNGATVAEAVYSLERSAEGWEFRTHAKPATMVALFISTEIREHSLLEIDGAGVRPLRYRYEQAGGEEKDDRLLHADYDWKDGTVNVSDNSKNRRLALSPLAQDPLSAQLAVIQCVKNDCGRMDYSVLDDLELEKRRFERGGVESLRTALGDYETVKVSYRSGRRETVMWLAPALNYIPVRIGQFRNDKLKSEMRITAVNFEQRP